jgi:hypothetical protein
VRNLARHMTFVTQVHYDAMLRMIRGMGARNTNSSLVVEAIPNMHKIRRRNRASPDTGSYWKVHM